MIGSYRGDDPIGRLIGDFHAQEAENMHNPVLAERVKFFKEAPEGRKQPMSVEEKIAAAAGARVRAEERARTGEVLAKTKKEIDDALAKAKKKIDEALAKAEKEIEML